MRKDAIYTQNAPAVDEALTVSAALGIVKRSLESIVVTVCGEVSELSDKAGYKAVYFTLSDKSASMSCLMWHDAYKKQDVRLKAGMLVEVSGSFSVWAAKGRMNFTARSLRLAGEGDLRIKVARIAQRLQNEGLMASERKKPVPVCPERIAVVTSPRGKAVHDCLRTLRRRYPLAEVLVCGVTVEGSAASQEIIRGLDVASASRPDVILLVRGGGSYEDLMPFNDEALARRIASSLQPIVTGIGHEPDNSIADMVSDLRCSTPTAAAEAVTPDRAEVAVHVEQLGRRLGTALSQKVAFASTSVEHIASRPILHEENELLGMRYLHVDTLSRRLSHAIPDSLARDNERIVELKRRMKRLPDSMMDSSLIVDARLRDALKRAATEAVEKLAARTELVGSRLGDLSPLAVLSRGYAIVYGADGNTVIDSVHDAREGDIMRIRVHDGIINGEIRSKKAFTTRGTEDKDG